MCASADGPHQRAEYRRKVDALTEKTDFREPGSKGRYKEIMYRNEGAYCLSLEDFVIGQLDAPELVLEMDGPPVVDQRRPMSAENEEWYRLETIKFDQMKLWKPPTPEMADKLCVCNPVIVDEYSWPKELWTKRLTVDYSPIHPFIKAPPAYIPNVHEMADRAGKAVLLSKDDGYSGYYQWKLAEESKHITGVYTPLGIRVFNCMPMGINVAPAKWNEAMANRFGDIPGDRYFGLMDDYMRFTPQGPGESRADVERSIWTTGGVPATGPGGAPEAEAVQGGTCARGDGGARVDVRPWPGVEDRRDNSGAAGSPDTRTAKELERFLALGNYYGNFVENFTSLATPLRPLARQWTKGAMAEGTVALELFRQLRRELADSVKLQMPDWQKRFVLKTDFSALAVAAALLQKGDDGKLRPIAFASRKCTDAEAKLGAPDGEMVALVWGVKRFEKYLLGRPFDAYVDQGSLAWLKDKRLSSINNRRLQGAFAYLRQFDWLHYLKASKMQDVDALSRAVPEDAEADDEAEARWVAAAALEAGLVTDGQGTVLVDVAPVAMPEAVVAAATAKRKAKHRRAAGISVAQVDMGDVWGFETELRPIGELQKLDPECMAIRELMGGQRSWRTYGWTRSCTRHWPTTWRATQKV